MPQQSNMQQGQTPTSSGLTLPQVISVIDKRLVNLETFMKETKDSVSSTSSGLGSGNSNINVLNATDNNGENVLEKIIDEFNGRFEIFAEEIANMKDVIMKLQSYTMDVNKTLLEERFHVLSDLGISQNGTAQKQGVSTENIKLDGINELSLTDQISSMELKSEFNS
jgi:hypothetical protein